MSNGLYAFVTVTKSKACRRPKTIQDNSLQEKGFSGSESLEISTHVLKKTLCLAAHQKGTKWRRFDVFRDSQMDSNWSNQGALLVEKIILDICLSRAYFILDLGAKTIYFCLRCKANFGRAEAAVCPFHDFSHVAFSLSPSRFS